MLAFSVIGVMLNPIFQGIVGVAVTIAIKKACSFPHDALEFTKWSKVEVAVGPDMLLIALLALCGKFARIRQYERSDPTLTARALADLNSLEDTVLAGIFGGVFALIVMMVLIPMKGWKPRPKTKAKNPPPAEMNGWGLYLPLITGTVMLVFTLFVVQRNPQ